MLIPTGKKSCHQTDSKSKPSHAYSRFSSSRTNRIFSSPNLLAINYETRLKNAFFHPQAETLQLGGAQFEGLRPLHIIVLSIPAPRKKHVKVGKPGALSGKEGAKEIAEMIGTPELENSLPIVEWCCLHVGGTTSQEKTEFVMVAAWSIDVSDASRYSDEYAVRENVAGTKESTVSHRNY